jgi:hypothetical protein
MSELLRVCLVLKIILMFYPFPILLTFSETHRAHRLLLFIQMTATLGINNRVNETLKITAELKITFQATNLVNGSCRSWHMVEALL